MSLETPCVAMHSRWAVSCSSGCSQLRFTKFLKVMAAMWRTPLSTVSSAATRSSCTACPGITSCCATHGSVYGRLQNRVCSVG